MMDRSFQLTIGGSSWMVSDVKIQTSLSSEPLNWCLDVLCAFYSFYLLRCPHCPAWWTDSSCLSQHQAEMSSETLHLSLKCWSVLTGTGRTAGRLFDSPERSSCLQNNDYLWWLFRSSSQPAVFFSLLLKSQMCSQRFLSVFGSFLPSFLLYWE